MILSLTPLLLVNNFTKMNITWEKKYFMKNCSYQAGKGAYVSIVDIQAFDNHESPGNFRFLWILNS